MTGHLTPAPTARLAQRARAGDRRARSRLHRRLHSQVHRFAFALVGDPGLAGHLARSAIDSALDSAHPDRFVAAALADVRRQVADQGIDRHGAVRVDTFDEGVERAVLLLVDEDGLTADDVAAVLAIPSADVARYLRRGRRSLGVSEEVSRCHGWALVRRLAELTPTEVTAARHHLDLCRSCADAHAAREASRARLRRMVPATGAAGTGIAAGVSALLSIGGSGVGAAAGAAVVAGALAAPLAILPHVGHHATGTTGSAASSASVSRSAAAALAADGSGRQAATATAGSAGGAAAGGTHRAHRQLPPGGQQGRPTPTTTTTGSVPSGSPSGGPTPTTLPSEPPTVSPTAVPTRLPTIVPTRLPTILPTALPTILPTTLPPIVPTTLPPLPTSLPPILPTTLPPLPCIPIVDPSCH